MSKEDTSKGHAVVIGSSIAGLLSAAALSPSFAKVTLLDADVLDYVRESRKATPQGNHVHGLLSSGWSALQELFPTIEAKLKSRGAHWVHFGKEFRWHHFGKVKAQFDDLMEGPFMSRSCLESTIYSEVLELRNIEVIEQCKVGELVGSAEKISAVRTQGGELIEADLVVDASGRASRVPEWLALLGTDTVRSEKIPVGLRYCSCRIRPPANHESDWKALFIIPKPPFTKAGAIFPLENGDWLVTLSGRSKDTMPKTEAEFLNYASSLDTDELYETIKGAEVISELRHFRYKESRRHYYDEAEMPKNLLVVGDAMCSFNPIFGQGMTVCALQALSMKNLVDTGGLTSSPFFKETKKVLDQAWDMIMVEDMRHSNLLSQRSFKVKCMQALTARVYDKTATDGQLNKLLYEVIHFKRPATDLCKPIVLWRLF